MSDIKVTLSGDASGAKEAFHGAGESAMEFADHIGEAAEKTKQMYEKLEKALEKVVEFGKESVEAYFKIEKATAQLERAAGEHTEALKAQALAMSEHLGVSNVTIETMQKMLYTFGEAPEQIEATTHALLDYAAYSGTDAVSATHALLTATQTGKTAFKELGLEYVKTGEASTTLTNITAALAGKIGGTSEDESKTIEGSVMRATAQIEHFKQAFGELIAVFIDHTGIIDRVGSTFKSITDALDVGGGRALKAFEAQHALAEGQQKVAEATERAASAEKDLQEMLNDPKISLSSIDSQTRVLEAFKKEAVDAEAAYARLVHGGTSGLGSENKNDHAVKAGHEAKVKKIKSDMDEIEDVYREEDAKDAQRELDNATHKKESEAKYVDELIKQQQEGQKKTMEEQDKEAAEVEKRHKKDVEARDKYLEEEGKQWVDGIKRNQDKVAEQNLKFQTEMTSAGMKIGNALSSALVGAIEAAMDGGEFDVLGAVADVAFAVAAIAADAIISIYAENPALGQAVGAGIGAIGGLEHHARASAWKSEQAAKAPKTHHDGGWIEPEYFHTGGMVLGTDERAAVLQTGEAVLSRSEVARNGGRSGVEALRRSGGRGGVNVYVSTMDAQSVTEAFQDKSGRGLVDAARTGQGPLALLFAGG